MADIYVSPTGSDTTGDGSYNNPYRHIYYAIGQASDGDTVIAKAGTYHEGDGVTITNKSVTLKSESENFEDVTIIVDGYDSGYYTAAYIVLQMTSSYTFTVKGITFKWGSATYSNAKIFIAMDSNAPNIIATYSFFDGSGIPSGDHHIGIGGRRSYNIKVYKCSFRHFKSDIWSGGVVVWDNNNTVDAKDCIFEDCEYGIKNYTGTLTEDYNCFYNNTYNLYSGSLGTNDIVSDPKFTSSSSAQIQNDSPCKNSGTTITGYVEDYEGDNPDIGAYEVPGPTQQTISSDSIIKGTTQQNINSDSKIINNRNSSTIQSEGVIKRTSQQTITSDTEISSPLTQQQINSDTTIVIRRQEHINSNSFIKYFKDFYARCRVSQSSHKDFNTQFKINQPTPIDPTGLSCTDLHTGEAVELTWNDVGNYGYNVYKDVGGSWAKLNKTVITGTHYIAGDLTANVSYTFKVTGVNGIDEESSGTTISGCTPTFNLEELSKAPIYKIYIDGVELQDAILERIELVYGPSFSTATFYLPTRHDTPGIPDANRQEVTIYINNRLVFTGRLVKRTDVYDATSIRVNYEAYSKLWDYTLYTAGKNFNVSDGRHNKKSISVSSVLSGSGCPSGLPGTLYGEVRVADMTRLEVMTDMIRYAGNYKIYTSPSGITSYYKVGNPATKRTYEIGKHILDYEMTKDISNKITSIVVKTTNSSKRINTRLYFMQSNYPFIYYDSSSDKMIYNDQISNLHKDKDGNYYFQFLLGKVTDVRVFALVNKKPEVLKFSDLSVTPGHIIDIDLSISDDKHLATFTRVSDIIESLAIRDDSGNMTGLKRWPDGSSGSKRVVLSYRTFKPAFKSIGANVSYGRSSTTVTIPNVPVTYVPFVLKATTKFIVSTDTGASEQLTPVYVMLDPWQYLTTIAIVYTYESNNYIIVSSSVGLNGAHRTIHENIDVFESVSIPSYIPYENYPKENYNEVLSYLSNRASAYIQHVNEEDQKGRISIIGDETLDLRTQVNGLEVVRITHDFTNGFITHIDLTNEKFYRGEVSTPELSTTTIKSRVFKDESSVHDVNLDVDKLKELSGLINKVKNPQKLGGEGTVYTD